MDLQLWGFPFGPDFNEETVLDMLADVGISYGGNRPRINATLGEILRMDLRMFFHIYDRWRDDLDQWAARQDARRGNVGI